jgi:hypothetical protein
VTQGAPWIVLAAAVALLVLVTCLIWAGRVQSGQVSRERRDREARERRRRMWARRTRGDE